MEPSERDDKNAVRSRATRVYGRLVEIFAGHIWQSISSPISREEAERRIQSARRFLFETKEYDKAYEQFSLLLDDVMNFLDRHRQVHFAELETLTDPPEPSPTDERKPILVEEQEEEAPQKKAMEM